MDDLFWHTPAVLVIVFPFVVVWLVQLVRCDCRKHQQQFDQVSVRYRTDSSDMTNTRRTSFRHSSDIILNIQYSGVTQQQL